MYFSFVDIGTSDFDTSISVCTQTQKVLLIEPIKEYLDSLPTGTNIYKENCAVGENFSSMEIYYIPPDIIKNLNLPEWVKGSNSIGNYHPIVKDLLESKNISLDIVKKERIDVVPLDHIIKKYNISSIENLKIDTEGYDHFIVKQVYNLIVQGMNIQNIKFEYNPTFNNTEILDSLVVKFISLGYNQSWSKKKRDVILQRSNKANQT